MNGASTSHSDEGRPPTRVMIDPSLLVARWKIQDTINRAMVLKDKEGYELFVPKAFLDFVESRDKLRGSAWLDFFSQRSRITDAKRLRDLVLGYSSLLVPFDITRDFHDKYGEFRRSLVEHLGLREAADNLLVDTLFQEWVFLVERSWIVSRIKRPFTHFIESGAASLSVGRETTRKAFDRLTRRTLKKNEFYLMTRIDRLRALGKWIAAGGSPVLSYYEPLMGALSGLASGIFLLVDP